MKCYIASQNRNFDLPPELNKENTLYYPESSMSTNDLLNTGVPLDYNIVTDCHFLIPLYDKYDVFIFENGHWVNPDMQTFGRSYNLILFDFWKGKSIPNAIFNGVITNVMGHSIT